MLNVESYPFLKTGFRLIGAVIRVGQDQNRNNPDCGTGLSSAPSLIDVTCDLEGRYLSISLPDNGEPVALCEVQITSGSC